jgi:hypothetical protein
MIKQLLQFGDVNLNHGTVRPGSDRLRMAHRGSVMERLLDLLASQTLPEGPRFSD